MRGHAERARVEGISRFTALMLAHHSPMRHLPAKNASTVGGEVGVVL
jgi:hypothetical protein